MFLPRWVDPSMFYYDCGTILAVRRFPSLYRPLSQIFLRVLRVLRATFLPPYAAFSLNASKRSQFAEHGRDQFRNGWVNVHCPLRHCVRRLSVH
jgi:hypothetical protein